jgi:hypothetical protein
VPCSSAAPDLSILGDRLEEEFPSAVDKLITLGSIQRFEERANDACVCKPITD